MSTYVRGTLEERFWAKVASPREQDECWLWIGSKDACGYGRIGRAPPNFKLEGAHRVSWELANGTIPAGMHVLHKCDHPACVNPKHLYLGDHKENMRDRGRKGRSSGGKFPGEKNRNAKLTEQQVDEIRKRLEAGETQRSVAKAFGVTQGHVSGLATGRFWRKA